MTSQSESNVSRSEMDRVLAEFHRDLGWKRLNRAWAKFEILLGLAAAGSGMLIAHSLTGAAPWLEGSSTFGLSLALITLGLYLALAGHRSHLYLSQAWLVAYLLARREKRRSP